MKKTVFRICLWVLLSAGILLCELVMQGSSVFFLMAVLLMGALARFALRKGEGRPVGKAVALLAALLVLLGILWVFNEIYGNPISKNAAKEAVQEYLEEAYPGKAVYVESVSHNMSAGSYEAWIAGKEGGFLVSWRDGKILYDTFEEMEG